MGDFLFTTPFERLSDEETKTEDTEIIRDSVYTWVPLFIYLDWASHEQTLLD
jgi:hypothetical protein